MTVAATATTATTTARGRGRGAGRQSAERQAYRAGWRMLGRELRQRRAALARVAAWSLPEALPALLSGLLVAHALDNGFLVHRPWAGLGWLAALGVLMAGRAVATRMSFPWLSATIEPLRDSLVRALVNGALRRAAASPGRPDTSSVAQLTSQVETVRQLFANIVDFGMNVQQAVDAGRFLSSPDGSSIDFETRYGEVDAGLRIALESKGHTVEVKDDRLGAHSPCRCFWNLLYLQQQCLRSRKHSSE